MRNLESFTRFSLNTRLNIEPAAGKGIGFLMNYYHTFVENAPARMFVEFANFEEKGPEAFIQPNKNNRTCPSRVILHGEENLQQTLPKTPVPLGLHEVGVDNATICAVQLGRGGVEMSIPEVPNEFRANFSVRFVFGENPDGFNKPAI